MKDCKESVYVRSLELADNEGREILLRYSDGSYQFLRLNHQLTTGDALLKMRGDRWLVEAPEHVEPVPSDE